jgi:hypothetical protein
MTVFPYLVAQLEVKHDGGIIVSAQPGTGKSLNYDGGVIGKVYYNYISLEIIRGYAMTAE